jgi:hypothetical protein
MTIQITRLDHDPASLRQHASRTSELDPTRLSPPALNTLIDMACYAA